MPLTAQYAVCEFDDASVSLVPNVWINFQLKECRWPSSKNSTTIRSFQRNCSEPGASWISYRYKRILAVAESYEDALIKEQKSQYESDCPTDSENTQKFTTESAYLNQQEIIDNSTLYTSQERIPEICFDFNENDVYDGLLNDQWNNLNLQTSRESAPTKSVQSVPTSNKLVQQSSNSSISPESVDECLNLGNNITLTNDTNIQLCLIQSNTPAQNDKSTQTEPSYTDIEMMNKIIQMENNVKAILKVLCDFKTEIITLNQNMKDNKENFNKYTIFDSITPITNITEFLHKETELANENTYDEYKKTLSEFWGTNANPDIMTGFKKLLKMLILVQLFKEFSWTSYENKIVVSSSLIFKAVQESSKIAHKMIESDRIKNLKTAFQKVKDGVRKQTYYSNRKQKYNAVCINTPGNENITNADENGTQINNQNAE